MRLSTLAICTSAANEQRLAWSPSLLTRCPRVESVRFERLNARQCNAYARCSSHARRSLCSKLIPNWLDLYANRIRLRTFIRSFVQRMRDVSTDSGEHRPRDDGNPDTRHHITHDPNNVAGMKTGNKKSRNIEDAYFQYANPTPCTESNVSSLSPLPVALVMLFRFLHAFASLPI